MTLITNQQTNILEAKLAEQPKSELSREQFINVANIINERFSAGITEDEYFEEAQM